MNLDNKLYRYLAVLGFAILILIPSFDTLLKYSGVKGILAYFIVGTALIFAGYKYALPLVKSGISERTANILAALTFIALFAVVEIVYPLANSGRFGGGSDADDALIMAAKAIVSGQYPYTQSTYLGNLISPMPGAVFFGMPFSLLGILAYQSIFWFGLLFFFVRHCARSSAIALGLVWLLLLFCPTVWQNFVTGCDYATNTIYIALLMWGLVKKSANSSSPEWQKILLAIFLGVGLSSRSNFLLTMPLLLSVLVQNAGWGPAIKYLTVSGVMFLLVTVPFWLYNPAGFAPLAAQGSKLKDLVDVLPYANIIIPGTGLLLTLIFSIRKMGPDCGVFFRNCAVVQLFILLFTCTVSSIKAGQPDLFLRQAGYGMFTLIFAALAAWVIYFGIGRDDQIGSDPEIEF